MIRLDMDEEFVLESCSTPSEILHYISTTGDKCEGYGSFGTFSTAIYDTAWVSMVYKLDIDQRSWLFPESFDYILDTQLHDGTWTTSPSDMD